MKITSVKNPRWGDVALTSILCEVTVDRYGAEALLFTAMANDPEVHGQQLWKDLSAGKYGLIGAFVFPRLVTKSAVAKPGPHVVA